jgi:hypothetical protein
VNVDTSAFQALTDQVAELAAQVAELARRNTINDAIIEEERARAVAEDRAARPRRHGHLRPVGDDAS